jgi:hypothetical protein
MLVGTCYNPISGSVSIEQLNHPCALCRKMETNNYLLTGNKLQLYFTPHILFVERSETNNSWRVNRREIKALMPVNT